MLLKVLAARGRVRRLMVANISDYSDLTVSEDEEPAVVVTMSDGTAHTLPGLSADEIDAALGKLSTQFKIQDLVGTKLKERVAGRIPTQAPPAGDSHTAASAAPDPVAEQTPVLAPTPAPTTMSSPPSQPAPAPAPKTPA